MIFMPGLGAGGAERVAARICGWLSGAGHKVALVTLSSEESDFYGLPAEVERHALDLQSPSAGIVRGISANFRRMRALRSEARRFDPDVALSLGDRMNILMLMSLAGMRCRKLISERADPVLYPLSRGWSMLRRLVYPWATLHISQSEYVSSWMRARFRRLRCVVIGNTGGQPLRHDASESRAGRPGDEMRLLAIGRLTHQKGFDLLLEAIAGARLDTGLNLVARIAGDGEDRSALEKRAQALGIADRTSFVGVTADIAACYVWADIFLMPSRFEGFPNALVEAMAAGIPSVAARCAGGLDDVLGPERDRYALEFDPGDVEGLRRQLSRLAKDPALREELAARALARAAAYAPERISERWLAVVEET